MRNLYKFPEGIKAVFDKILETFPVYTVLWAGSIMTTGFYFMVLASGVFKKDVNHPGHFLDEERIKIYIGTADDIQLYKCDTCFYRDDDSSGTVAIGNEVSGNPSPFNGKRMYFFHIKNRDEDRFECRLGDSNHDELELFEIIQTSGSSE
jgi:hypothetical protein